MNDTNILPIPILRDYLIVRSPDGPDHPPRSRPIVQTLNRPKWPLCVPDDIHDPLASADTLVTTNTYNWNSSLFARRVNRNKWINSLDYNTIIKNEPVCVNIFSPQKQKWLRPFWSDPSKNYGKNHGILFNLHPLRFYCASSLATYYGARHSLTATDKINFFPIFRCATYPPVCL